MSRKRAINGQEAGDWRTKFGGARASAKERHGLGKVLRNFAGLASRAGLRRIAWINHFINNVYDDNE